MEINEATFVISSTEIDKCPKSKLPEYAFIGRSNVGKSSLLNMLTNNQNLAKISGRPGKTRVINHFLINKEWYMVDLPGYGFARASKADIENWKLFVNKYLCLRQNLFCVFVLIDIRLEPQKIDLDFIEWLGENEIPFAIAFTKHDKISKNQVVKSVELFKNKMLETWEEMPTYFVTSAETGFGRDELLDFIAKTNKKK